MDNNQVYWATTSKQSLDNITFEDRSGLQQVLFSIISQPDLSH